MIDNIQDLYAMFKDSVKGRYKLHPVTLGMVAGGLLYLIMPLDFLPDYIPLIGLVDDLAVLTVVFNSIKDELEDYRQWRLENSKS